MRKIIFITTVLLFGIVTLNAQSSSVYTRYGIGDLEYGYSPRMIGIGDLGVSILDPDHIIVTNPASWSVLNRTRVEFSFGYRGDLISDANRSNFTSETEFKGFTIGFPISKDYGIGAVLGLVPYSRVSYKAVQNLTYEDESLKSYKILYEGKGGLSKIFLGSSVGLPFGFSAGATIDYYFGNQSYLSTIEFEDNNSNINTIYENNRRTTGFGTTAGIISSNLARDLNINLFSDLRLGFSFNYIANLNTDTLYTSTSLYLVDTLAIAKTEMQVPTRFNSGISFVLGEAYNISLDYMFQPMSKFSFDNKPEVNLRDANKLSAAFEYKPKRTIGMTTWEQIVWRAGLSYEQTQYTFNGTGINQFSTYAGFSYPLGVENTLDLAFEYSKRGTTENNLLSENSFKIFLGVSFGELWFLRFDK
ncbi:MAG TPA: hypothetical protein DHV28_15505 [Ignavibacteriales bacterium]|nr:hypothetical protein [Ignavibacteriales bacterium]